MRVDGERVIEVTPVDVLSERDLWHDDAERRDVIAQQQLKAVAVGAGDGEAERAARRRTWLHLSRDLSTEACAVECPACWTQDTL
jgi:hypothetical protein